MSKLLMILFLSLLPFNLVYANDLNSPFTIGIVIRDNSVTLVSTTEKSLQDKVVLTCFSLKKICKPILSDALVAVGESESVEDIATGKNIYTYSLPYDELLTDIGIAIIYPKNNANKINVYLKSENNISITVDGLRYRIYSCTSNEGVHVYSDLKNAHLYYSLGYEIKANCPVDVYE
ncbi:hypothetical protein WJW69_001744 [Salmonella enterica]